MSHLDYKTKMLAETVGRAVALELLDQLRRGDAPVACEYLTDRQVALMTGFTRRALEGMRSRGEGPPWLKVGSSIRYRAADVRAWIEGGAR